MEYQKKILEAMGVSGLAELAGLTDTIVHVSDEEKFFSLEPMRRTKKTIVKIWISGKKFHLKVFKIDKWKLVTIFDKDLEGDELKEKVLKYTKG